MIPFLCFIVAFILLVIDAVRTGISLSGIAMALIALGLAFAYWPEATT